MAGNLGFGALIVAFVTSFYGIGAAIYGARKNLLAWVESARMAMLLTFPLITISVLCLVYLLATGHYEVEFVYSVTSSSMPLYLKITALWGGQAGSLLLWSWLMSAFASAVCLRSWERDREFLPGVIVVSLVTLAFFIGLSIFIENPFARFWFLPTGEELVALIAPAGAQPIFPDDGRGLEPLLRHPGMVIHPPMLYLGYVSFVIPYAFGIAALITGRSDDRWIRITRRWTLVAWLFLSIGLLLGSRWAYDVLGWGGYWAWDPVETSSLMPWLTGTAFLHSVIIQEKRGLFKQWNMILIIVTYALVIYGTFLTRSGVLSSVHAFAQSAIGPLFFGFIGFTFLTSLALVLFRWETLRAEGQMTSLLSREALFLYNNLLFVGIVAICFGGVNFPLISELLTGQKVTVGPPFYEKSVGPLFGALILLMGVAPLSAWGFSTWQTYGKSIWKSVIASLIILAGVILVGGVTEPMALLAFWICAIALSVTVYEYGRAVVGRSRTTGEKPLLALWRLGGRNQRRFGGYIIHIGVVLMALGIIGIEMFQTETQGTIPKGGTLTLGNYSLLYKDLAVFDTEDGRNVARAVVSISRGGSLLGEVYPRRDYYYDSQRSVTIAGLRSTMEDDLYIILVDWQSISNQGTTFKVFRNPLVNWLWVGGWVFILGTFVAAWPNRERQLGAKGEK